MHTATCIRNTCIRPLHTAYTLRPHAYGHCIRHTCIRPHAYGHCIRPHAYGIHAYGHMHTATCIWPRAYGIHAYGHMHTATCIRLVATHGSQTSSSVQRAHPLKKKREKVSHFLPVGEIGGALLGLV